MKQHRYRITVEHLSDLNGGPSPYNAPLSFEAGNHDDLFRIVEKVRGRGDFDVETATAFAIGLKLFGEVVMQNRQLPGFEGMGPQCGVFMKKLKQGIKAAEADQPASPE